ERAGGLRAPHRPHGPRRQDGPGDLAGLRGGETAACGYRVAAASTPRAGVGDGLRADGPGRSRSCGRYQFPITWTTVAAILRSSKKLSSTRPVTLTRSPTSISRVVT